MLAGKNTCKTPEGLYQSGLELLKQENVSEAITQLLSAAESGYATAQVALGELYSQQCVWIPTFYFSDPPVNTSYQKAAYWFQKAAEQGNPFGMMGYGLCLFRGLGVDQDRNKGLNLLFQAEETPDDGLLDGWPHQFTQDWIEDRLIEKIYSENYGEEIERRIFQWFQKLYETGSRGYLEAYLAECYFLGFGTEKDYQKALQYFIDVVDDESLNEEPPSGRTVFSYVHNPYERIGQCYENGLGTDKDLAKAFWWYKVWMTNIEGEETEDLFITFARCYAQGIGVAPDRQIAEMLCDESIDIRERAMRLHLLLLGEATFAETDEDGSTYYKTIYADPSIPSRRIRLVEDEENGLVIEAWIEERT